jgi:hypothetical protein
MRTHPIIRLLIFFSLVPCLGWAQQPTPQRLEKDRPIERSIGGAGSHNYALRMKKGQFCYTEIDQRGVDVVVRVFAPDGKRLQEIDSPNGFTGEFYSAELETSYRLKVQDGKLVALHQRNDMVSLTPTVTDQFAGNQWWFRGVHFQRNAQGAIAGFTITGGRVRYLRFVKRA